MPRLSSDLASAGLAAAAGEAALRPGGRGLGGLRLGGRVQPGPARSMSLAMIRPCGPEPLSVGQVDALLLGQAGGPGDLRISGQRRSPLRPLRGHLPLRGRIEERHLLPFPPWGKWRRSRRWGLGAAIGLRRRLGARICLAFARLVLTLVAGGAGIVRTRAGDNVLALRRLRAVPEEAAAGDALAAPSPFSRAMGVLTFTPFGPLGHQDGVHHALVHRLHLHGGLVGLDLGDDVAGGDGVAGLHVPLGEHALLHGGREGGHEDVGHRGSLAPQRQARLRWARLGPWASQSRPSKGSVRRSSVA